ncbi:MAG TPA: hypothetical protein VMH89_08490 [Candidatus Acidoferrum sp.]|nr:hypothetical protein [Candidatus Acidoferrum sp.]
MHRKVVEAIATIETTFSRDARPIEYPQKAVLPELVGKRAATQLE